jgi:two-component system, LytTR family, sensor kinase
LPTQLLDRWNGLSVFWRIQIVGWALFAVADLIGQRLLYHNYAVAGLRTAIVTACLVAMSAAIRPIYAERAAANRVTVGTVALIVLLSLLGGAVIATAIVLIHQRVPWIVPPDHRGVEEFLLPQIHYSFALAGWSLAFLWIQAEVAEQSERRRAVDAEAEALRAELEELRLQLDPHFLFNALNGVAEEIPEHPQAALAMLRDLTAYLRHSLDGIDHTVVKVEAEVGGLTAYLGVQRARFGDRLRATLQLAPAAASRRIASFLLQPLVENAIKHGRHEQGIDLRIAIGATGEALHIRVENKGTLAPPKATAHRHRPGIGLQNVRRRLALHYPGRHAFDLGEVGERPEDRKVVVTLVLEGEPCGS